VHEVLHQVSDNVEAIILKHLHYQKVSARWFQRCQVRDECMWVGWNV